MSDQILKQIGKEELKLHFFKVRRFAKLTPLSIKLSRIKTKHYSGRHETLRISRKSIRTYPENVSGDKSLHLLKNYAHSWKLEVKTTFQANFWQFLPPALPKNARMVINHYQHLKPNKYVPFMRMNTNVSLLNIWECLFSGIFEKNLIFNENLPPKGDATHGIWWQTFVTLSTED